MYMADSFSKKEREKKKARKKKEKELKKAERQSQGKQTEVFMYVDRNGNFTETKPQPGDSSDFELDNNSKKESEDKGHEGHVKFFDPEKGFGFIKASGKLGDVYFNVSSGEAALTVGQKVSFSIKKTERGYQAINVRF